MEIPAYLIPEIVPFVIGDTYAPKRSGRQLVTLFNQYGCKDIYDNNNGLPSIGKKDGLKTTRSEYVENRLNFLSGKPELRNLLTKVINELQVESQVEKLNKILQRENHNIIKKEEGEGYLIEGGIVDNSEPAVNEAHFEYIQNRILEALENAKVSITVAMAWFTNKILLDKLIKKSEEGISVQVAIYDDGINKKHGVDLSNLPHKKIKGTKGGISHNKFCVIDNQVVITGSYNWSNNAEYRNDENITIQNDPKQATLYSVEYNKLVKD